MVFFLQILRPCIFAVLENSFLYPFLDVQNKNGKKENKNSFLRFEIRFRILRSIENPNLILILKLTLIQISQSSALFKARFKRRATAVPNSIDRIKFDFSTALARRLKPSRAIAIAV